jgi:hypothetical protein
MNHTDYLLKFSALTDEMQIITKKKNHDYATDNDAFRNFREFGTLGVLVRMSDKFARLKTALVEKRDFKVGDENIRDTALDLAVYSLILILILENEQSNK